MTTRTATSSALPAAPGGLIGREEDLGAVRALLDRSRLVTVTGPAGVGKTRLAVAAADAFADGACLVELADARRPDEVAAAVAAALSIDAGPGAPLLDTLADALAHRRLMLVLDNCEHLVQACAELVDRLLRETSGVVVLATSQEALSVPGEWVRQIEPLAVPPPDAPTDPDGLLDFPAVRLFTERASAQAGGFALSSEAGPAVAEICRRLDGNPLAIELAAARVSMLGVEEIARRLDHRFELLTAGFRTALPRHQTLQAALEWSHDLLTGPERVLFRRLAVFAGGWTLDAAVEVCAGGDIAVGSVFDVLCGLVSKSLVVVETGVRSRYRFLDTTGSYARQRLVESGEHREFASRQVEWCVELAERAEPELASGSQREWLGRLEVERENLRLALTCAVEVDPETAMRMAGSLVLFWSMRGRFKEGLRWLEQLNATGRGEPVRRAVTLWGAALLSRALADFPTAKERATASLALAREAGDQRLVARALNGLGAAGVAACHGSSESLATLEESVDLASQVGDVWCEVASLVSMGFGHLIRGESGAARERFERCLEVAERPENRSSEAHRLHALIGLGRVELTAGDHRAAEPLLEEAESLARGLGLLGAAANALRFLGEAATIRGDYDTARDRFQASLEVGRRIGATVPVALALSALGQLALEQGDAAGASGVLRDARNLGAGREKGTGSACVLARLGAAERARGDEVEARTRLDEALTAARRTDNSGAVASALHELGRVAYAEKDYKQAGALLHDALALYREHGDKPAIAGCLESLAQVEAEEGRLVVAARLLGAAQALRDAAGLPRAPVDRSDHDADVAVLRRALGPERYDRALAEGMDVPLEDALAYAARGRGHRGRPRSGWAALSSREREVVTHAVRGLTNPEIGQRMLISPRTVQFHIANAFTKLGVSSRKQLPEVAAREGAFD